MSNTLPIIARWKILDNIRRSLVAPSLLIWLIAACAIFPGRPLLWSLFVLLNIAFPVYLHVSTGLLIHPRGIPWTSHFWTVWGDIRTNTFQIILTFLFLPHQAYLMADAIVRTLYRKLISHKNLLEWVSAAEAERSARQDFGGFLFYMMPAVGLTLVHQRQSRFGAIGRASVDAQFAQVSFQQAAVVRNILDDCDQRPL